MSNCPYCNEEMIMMVDVTMTMPSKFESQLTKKLIATKDVQLYAANWDRARYICKCGFSYGGIPSYVRKMENEIIELKAKLENLTPKNSSGRMHSCDIPGCTSCGNPDYDEECN